MTVQFWVGIVCNGCGLTYDVQAAADRYEYLADLTQVRKAAALAGWSYHKGHRNRSVDLCRACTTAR